MSHRMDVKQEIRARLDIVEVIGREVALKKSGKDYVGLCPFHTEKTPSFFVVPSKGFYKCFGCGRSGDIFRFIMEKHGVDFPTALRHLAELAGIEIPKRGQGHRVTADETRRSELQLRYETEASARWGGELGIHTSVEAFHLGGYADADGKEPTLVLPVWGDEDRGTAPGGWITYRALWDHTPRRLGLDPASRPGLEGTLFVAPHALVAARDDLLLFVVDPVICVRLYESGYRASFSVVRTEDIPADYWVSEKQVREVVERSNGVVDRIGLVVPVRHSDRAVQGRLEKLLHQTELELLAAGVEPLLIDVREDGARIFGWEWAASHDADAVRRYVSDPRHRFDVFDLRVGRVAARRAKGAMSIEDAATRLVPALGLVRATNRLLYEFYVAWAERCVPGLDRVTLERYALGLVDGEESVAF